MDRVFRGIGSFSVKFRWVIIAAWLIAAVAVAHFLPSLASVTQGNNANFLPASAPSEHAATLAKPFGGSNEVPVLVLAARSSAPLAASDQTWLGTLQTDLRQVKTVTLVRDLGLSADGHATQIEVLSNVSQGNSHAVTDLVDNLRTAISRASPPSGLSVHLAGAIPIAVDQQKQTGNTGSQIQGLSVLFIIVLLLLIFRAALAPLITLLPAFLAITIAGPLVAEAAQAGLKVSQLAQILLIVLVLGAGTDYGLFLVFRVREQLRNGLEPKEAVISSLTRVGESITFSAATVIAALLSLLVATFQIYSTLGIPLAIGIGVMLLAGLTLLPALLAVFGRAAFWPSKTRGGTGKIGIWGRVAGRITQHPAVILEHRAGRLRRAGRRLAGLQGRGLRRRDQRARAQRLGRRADAADQVLPEQHGQPDEHHLQAAAAGLGRPGRDRQGRARSCPAAACSPRSPGRSTRPVMR